LYYYEPASRTGGYSEMLNPEKLGTKMNKCENKSFPIDLESTFISFILFNINDVTIHALSHLSIITKPIL